MTRVNWVSIDGWLSGRPERIYRMISGDDSKSRHNSMRQMREAFGLPTGNEAIPEWLEYWDSISSDQRLELRRMDLGKLFDSNIPSPPGVKL